MDDGVLQVIWHSFEGHPTKWPPDTHLSARDKSLQLSGINTVVCIWWSESGQTAQLNSYLCFLPVIVQVLVPEQQVSEAEAGRQWRHLALLLLHLKSGDVQDNPAAAAAAAVDGVGLESRRSGAGGGRGEQWRSRRGNYSRERGEVLGGEVMSEKEQGEEAGEGMTQRRQKKS